MQRQSTFLALLVLACAPLASSLSTSASATSQARLFLRAHVSAPPSGDQLAELRTENPEAYAIVKALLTKRSLGLLDPKHPTASFAKTEQPERSAEEQGPEVFQKMETPEERAHVAQPQAAAPKVDMPYADVQAPPPSAHRDWLSWKPQSAAMDDETMVQNVLGAVAQLKGGKTPALRSKQAANQSPLVADESSMAEEQAAPAVVPAKPAAPAAPHENSYLKSIDFGIRAPQADEVEQPAAPKAQENSYLKGMDLSGDMPKAVASSSDTHKKAAQVQSSSNNYLASFSWDDSKPQEQVKQKPQEPQVDPSKDSLLSWLGVVKKAPVQAPAAPAQPANPYIMDLS